MKEHHSDFDLTSVIAQPEGFWRRNILEGISTHLESHTTNRDILILIV